VNFYVACSSFVGGMRNWCFISLWWREDKVLFR